jgi:hypothetical protein
MLSALCGAPARQSCTQCCSAQLDVQQAQEVPDLGGVATVLLRPPRLVRCSMATVGGMPKTASTSGRPAGCTMLRA